MEVILLEKLKNLGNLGDKITVRPGYARNFLIPRQKAILATSENLKIFEARRAELEKQQGETLAYAQSRAASLAEMKIVIAEKVGVEGKLFGSVSPVTIAKAITAAGVEVKKQEVRLPTGPIRQTGEHQVWLHLHPDVDTEITIQVIESK
jgi:large subunit ribosomal protein L9